MSSNPIAGTRLSDANGLADDFGLMLELGMLPCLRDAPEASRRSLLQCAQSIDHPINTTIANCDEGAQSMYIILSGHIGAYTYSKKTQETLVDILGPGTFIGLGQIFLDRPHGHTYRTLGPTRTLSIASEDLVVILSRDWPLLRSMMGGLAQRIHGLVGRINSQIMHKAEQRIAAHFLEYSEQNGQALSFFLPYEKRDLAAHLGLAPETLSRALKNLNKYGVYVQGRNVVIHDRLTLETMCCHFQPQSFGSHND